MYLCTFFSYISSSPHIKNPGFAPAHLLIYRINSRVKNNLIFKIVIYFHFYFQSLKIYNMSL